MMKTVLFALFSVIFLCVIVSQSAAFDYHWEIDETPEGQESVTVVEPVQVTILDEQVEISSHSASIWLMERYSVHLGTEWSGAHAYKLLQTFESIPQNKNDPRNQHATVPISLWRLSNRHIQNDIEIEFQGDTKVVTIAAEAFTYAKPLLAEIEGVRGRYFSKRLHRAVVRFITDGGADRHALERILQERYAVSINIPDYTELTRYTTGEHAGRFSTFKNEELLALISMFEEFPRGMHKVPGLKYLVRRLDGTSHPTHPTAPAVAWPSAGYIEFMESAFKEKGLDYIHRLILHEKAHFLWAHLFDEQLKRDWIELGGWFNNPDVPSGWSTTKQTEFVSAYAHGVNPNEDMAESISFYIVRPDKLRSRSPAKYEFIQNRIMHGTRYISQIREDLTFEVYNLYPDYVYPGRIIRIDIQVDGKPEEDKLITVEIEIHRESDLDNASRGYARVWSQKGTREDIHFRPIGLDGNVTSSGSHILRSQFRLSRYAANGFWRPYTIEIKDAQGNERYSGDQDFGWNLYIDNPLEDLKPPEYIRNSMRLSLSEANEDGKPYQIVTARWRLIEENGVDGIYAHLYDATDETYSRRLSDWGEYKQVSDGVWEATAKLKVPNYLPSGIYKITDIVMKDLAQNRNRIFFTEGGDDELPATIDVQTTNPDLEPPVLDLNRITIKAEPTNPEASNGETRVDITFRVKDNISGHRITYMSIRNPQGVMLNFDYYDSDFYKIYFTRDPSIYETYHKTIILPAGSPPGIWGLDEMTIYDKAQNKLNVDFTEIVRFKVDDGTVYAQSDVNEDGQINILDLVIVASFDASNERADVNGDGTINILDLVAVASNFGEEELAAPAIYSATADQIQSWITQAMQADDGSPAFRRGIRALQNLLLKTRPETTALLPNYPNPFNPETWIPYHLANASDVQITIYNAKGSIIRTLSVGHQAAGYYTDRDRAAYWDGRNGLGERIASGIYFYQLQADSISQLRKMVILK